MSKNCNSKTPNPNNPSSLEPRYEIRKLGPEHERWAAAIVGHSNSFHSPIWPNLYPVGVTKRMHDLMDAMTYLSLHQINSGLSYGVFDTEYEYKTQEAKEVGGKLFWDPKEPGIQEEKGLEAESDRLLQQMDFPLVSVALSYDSFNALDMDKMKPLLKVFPHFGLAYHILDKNDTRDAKSWKATGPAQVLFRNATSTRHDYEGKGIMGSLARWLMREAHEKGFRGIQIECFNDAVTHVWSKAEPPFKGNLVSEFHTGTWKDEEGKIAFAPVQQRMTKCYVEL